MASYAIDLLDDEDSWVDVNLMAHSAPPIGAAYAFYVLAVSRRQEGSPLPVTTWIIPVDVDKQWRGQLGPDDDPERRDWYARGILQLYCRSVPALWQGAAREVILSAEAHYDVFAQVDRPFERGLSLEGALGRMEFTIVDLLLQCHEQRERIPNHSAFAAWHFWLSRFDERFVVLWQEYEPLLRQRRDGGDERIVDLYPALDALAEVAAKSNNLLAQMGFPYRARDEIARLAKVASRALRALAQFLPAPRLVTDISIAPRPAPEPALRLARIELENIRCFEHTTIDLVENGESLDWALVVGDNHHGKSTLLRAVACLDVLEAGNELVFDELECHVRVDEFFRDVHAPSPA